MKRLMGDTMDTIEELRKVLRAVDSVVLCPHL